uniref:Cytochrome P450 n=1 Tax=Sinopodophyllum hexandrum TaxID=93608 RepID=A0A0N9HQ32_SINHE|nr:cytochrome P450 [Sinopodophyllum hexandrum]
MELWFIFLLFSISLAFFLKSLINLLIPSSKSNNSKLPPGPRSFPFLGNIQLIRSSFADLEPLLRRLRPIYGPIITLNIGPRKAIFIITPELAHQALIHQGSAFADRPPAAPTSKIISSNQHSISSASYGPVWRVLRRNLSSEILHPSRVKAFSHGRKWVLDVLIQNLRSESGSDPDTRPVFVLLHFQYAMFCLLVFMCYGEKYDDKVIREIQRVQKSQLLSFAKFAILNLLPKLGKILFRKKWAEFNKIHQDHVGVLLPLIKARQEKKLHHVKHATDENLGNVTAYVDTLFDLTLSEDGGRKLTDDEMVSLCSEFLNGGTDTTSTALQWIIAELVKNQDIQLKLFNQVKEVVSPDGEIKEEDLEKLPYLRAVVLEGLRRHPPGHFVLPHRVTQDVELDGYLIPKHASVNFFVAEIGLNPKVWEDPMEFRPERFLGDKEGFDVTGSREIKMMPFGAGRRICPGWGLALLHLEYFLANLVMNFMWTVEDGCEVDLSEKQEFTTVMKNPLKACITPRVK